MKLILHQCPSCKAKRFLSTPVDCADCVKACRELKIEPLDVTFKPVRRA